MPKAAKRNGWKRWTVEDLQQLRALAQADVPKEVIGLRLGRTTEAVAQRAWLEGIPLAGRQTAVQRAAVRRALHSAAQGDRGTLAVAPDAPDAPFMSAAIEEDCFGDATLRQTAH